MNLYAVLGISRDADGEDIRSAYRVQARRCHPDIGPGGSAEKFRQITEAYEVLRDPDRREAYDRSLAIPIRVATPPEPLRPSPTVLDLDWLFIELLSFLER